VCSSDLAFTVINGSKFVTWPEDANNNDAGKYDTDAADAIVGDFLRFGHATTKTFPVYKIIAMTGAATTNFVVELDRAYEGASGSVAANAVGVIPAANVGDFGIKLTGLALADANFDPTTDEPFIVSFDVQLGENFETAAHTLSTRPLLGTGSYQQVRALEAYTQFQIRGKAISAYPPTTRYYQAVAGETYNIASFEIWDEKFIDATTGINPKSPTRIVLAVDDDLTEDFHTVIAGLPGYAAVTVS
jgi:hypothetical protein